MAKIRGGAVKPATPEQLIGHYNTQAFTLQQQKDALLKRVEEIDEQIAGRGKYRAH